MSVAKPLAEGLWGEGGREGTEGGGEARGREGKRLEGRGDGGGGEGGGGGEAR